LKGDESEPIKTVSGVRQICSQKAWMTQNLFIKWIDFEFAFVARDKTLLVFDAARSHISNKVKAHLHERGILFAVIPGGLTGLLQPCDVVWFKPLRQSMKQAIDSWKARPNHELTRGGNARPPTINDMSVWLADAWRSVPQDQLRGSFQRCFLGDALYLHIAQHELYGDAFRSVVAELTGGTHRADIPTDVGEESDPAEIEDD
jgi:hypothetical protein